MTCVGMLVFQCGYEVDYCEKEVNLSVYCCFT